MFAPSEGAIIANRFRLRRMIGQGGMGEVWEAHDVELDSPCALKFILGHLSHDAGMRARFLREARAAARLRSPHATNILGVGEHAEAMYMAMELLDGETLADRLERAGRLDVTTTLLLIRQTVQVLDKAHAMGVVHRDLKPENLWLTPELPVFVKVLDFGVAKSTVTTASKHTATGALIGTPHYMSPEQARGDRLVDHRSDLWALGIIALECLGGRRPFEGTGLGDLLVKVVATTPPPIRELAPHLPRSMEQWWLRALAREPDRRFQSGSELLEALRRSLESPVPGAAAAPAMSAASLAGAPTERQASGTLIESPRADQGSSMSPLESTHSPARPSPRRRHWWLAPSALGLLGVLAAAWQIFPRGGTATEVVPLSQVQVPPPEPSAPPHNPQPVEVRPQPLEARPQPVSPITSTASSETHPPAAEDVPKPVNEAAAPNLREQVERTPAAAEVSRPRATAKAPLPKANRPAAPKASAATASVAKPSPRSTAPAGPRAPATAAAAPGAATRTPAAVPPTPVAPAGSALDQRLGF